MLSGNDLLLFVADKWERRETAFISDFKDIRNFIPLKNSVDRIALYITHTSIGRRISSVKECVAE